MTESPKRKRGAKRDGLKARPGRRVALERAWLRAVLLDDQARVEQLERMLRPAANDPVAVQALPSKAETHDHDERPVSASAAAVSPAMAPVQRDAVRPARAVSQSCGVMIRRKLRCDMLE